MAKRPAIGDLFIFDGSVHRFAARSNEMLACASPNELGRQGDEDDCHHAQQGHLQPEVLGKSNFGGEVRTHVHHLPKLFSLYFGC